MQVIASFPPGVNIVGMVVHNDKVYVATEYAVYRIDEDPDGKQHLRLIMVADRDRGFMREV